MAHYGPIPGTTHGPRGGNGPDGPHGHDGLNGRPDGRRGDAGQTDGGVGRGRPRRRLKVQGANGQSSATACGGDHGGRPTRRWRAGMGARPYGRRGLTTAVCRGSSGGRPTGGRRAGLRPAPTGNGAVARESRGGGPPTAAWRAGVGARALQKDRHTTRPRRVGVGTDPYKRTTATASMSRYGGRQTAGRRAGMGARSYRRMGKAARVCIPVPIHAIVAVTGRHPGR